MQNPRFPLVVFYDGSCRVCAKEMDHYRDKAPPGRIVYVDIADPEFDPASYGKSREDFMEQLHVRDADGRFYLAVDGFWAIWQAFPAASLFGVLGRVVRWPVVAPVARFAYRLFARMRKYLPQNRQRCEEGSCPLDHSR